MKAWLTGLVTTPLLLLATVMMFIPMMLVALLKLIPLPAWQRLCSRLLMWIAESWAQLCRGIFALFTPVQWDIRGTESLRRDTSYLVICNHQSWVDIPALMQALNRKTPYFKFFLKQELIWIPFLGLAFWALDYPFMKRYPKSVLAKRPELRGKDMEITRQACEKFRHMPVTIVNYLEGTRFTPEKQARQRSPHNYLLKPKAGGMAFVLGALGDSLDAILDMTVVYPDQPAPGFGDLLCGRVRKVVVDIRVLPLTDSLRGDYEHDAAYRVAFHQWLKELWQEKDARIGVIKQELAAEQRQR